MMAGIQETADENGAISPGMNGTSSPIVVQAPVPPQFADEPPTSTIQEDFSSIPLLGVTKECHKSVTNDIKHISTDNSHSISSNTTGQVPDRSMVSFLPMSASLEDDSVVNLTRF